MFGTKLKALAFAASALAAAAVATPGTAQDYPVDPIVIITHSSPGGGSDVYLREMSKFLVKALGTDVVVENVTGGSSAKAIAKLATSKADGGTFYGATPVYINMSLLSNPEYGAKDTEPVVNFFLDPQVVYVRKDSPLHSLADVVAAAKANPGTQKWGTGTPAALERGALEKFKKMAGVDITIVTHDGGGDMMVNVLNGSLDLGIGEVQEFRGQLDAGEVRVIGVFSDERLREFPDVMTAKETGYDLVIKKFRGLIGPKGLPDDVIAAWEAAIPKVLEDPEFKKWYEAQSLIPAYMPHADFVPFVASVIAEQDAFFTEYGIK